MAKNYRKAKHIMLDIETLDTNPSAVVLSIGAISFEFTSMGIERLNSIHVFPSIREQIIRLNRTMSADTIKWWTEQSAEAKDSVISGAEVSVSKAMNHLAIMVATAEPDFIWAQGASFDFPIMSSLAGQVSAVELWPFWKERDCRTVLGMPEDGPVDRGAIATEYKLTPHSAIDDCTLQALAMHKVLFPQRA